MALRKTITTSSDITLEAYIKIDSIEFSPKWRIRFSAYYFKDRAAALAKKQPVSQPQEETVLGEDFDIYFSEALQKTEGNDLLTLLYRYLKTRPEFSGAEDVLEEGQTP
jgi:hypothetical protein